MLSKNGKKLLLHSRNIHSRNTTIISPQKTNNALEETKWKLMATELCDSIVRMYQEIPYKNSIKLSPALQKLQQQLNNNSVVKYAWSAISALAKTDTTTENKMVAKQVAIPRWKQNKTVISKACILSRTRHLNTLIKTAETDQSRLTAVEALISHLHRYPESKYSAVSEGITQTLLYTRHISKSEDLHGAIREAFALLGQAEALPANGIRVLAIDGGGVRGLLVVEMLKKLEELTGRKVCEMFDLVCGVSTGAILASLLVTQKVTLEELGQKYKEMSVQIFNQSRLNGTTNLVLNHSYYDTALWEKIIKEHLGEITLTSTNRNPKCPKLCTISAIVNQPRLHAYVFRNYALPCRVQSQYDGSSNHLLWEAVRASAAAPMYFGEFRTGSYLHQDGGIIVNNPTAVALHEAKLLWPDSTIQCVVSFGTGRTEKDLEEGPSGASSSWKNKFKMIIESATDTEGVHMMLCDLLPSHTYFRFNPYLAEVCSMEETDPGKIEQMERDVLMYVRRNDDKFKEAAEVLLQEKQMTRRVLDWVKEKRHMLGAAFS